MQKSVTLAMGNGGQENNELITKIFYKYFKNDILEKCEDAAIIKIDNEELRIENEGAIVNKIAMSTDSFTVSPLFFPGSDIGKLSICGTCNDLAMMGAKPKYLTVSFIIEEGFNLRDLEKIVRSMKKELEVNGAKIVSGDTKVMPKGTIDKLIVNTTGVGEVLVDGISSNSLQEDDVILVSRDIGAHGATIFMAREGIELDSELKSDCASLYPSVKALIDTGVKLRAMRDATRGGVAAVLNEWAKQNSICIEVEEEAIPISTEVKGACEMLGFEATALANEGTFCIALPKEEAQKALEVLKELNSNASIIGKVEGEHKQRVVLKSSYGTKRFLDMPTGELLPRIC